MEITDKRVREMTAFKLLECGSVFMFNGEPHIKCGLTENEWNAVGFAYGTVEIVPLHREVEVVSAELIIKNMEY